MYPRCHGIQGPATRTAARVCGGFIRKIRHCGEPHPLALNADEEKGPLWGGYIKAPSYGRDALLSEVTKQDNRESVALWAAYRR
jgi:hypothetical protein